MSDTQRVCMSQPFCLCVGEVNEWDECCCTGNIVGCSSKQCEACGAELELIDFETGEKVA
jgi:hypothetical protein